MKKPAASRTDAEANVEPEFRFPKTYRIVPPDQRHRAAAGETSARNCKVRVNIYFDADIVQFFKKRAADPNAAPYQTQINAALRDYVERSRKTRRKEPPAAVDSLLRDERFIDAVAERIARVQLARGKPRGERSSARSRMR
ncbi:MAG: BrnA antitoxin family protein [bacterium]